MSQDVTTRAETAEAAGSEGQAAAAPLAAGKTPVGPGAITVVGLLLAVAVIGLGVLGIQTALVSAGALTGTSWLTWLLRGFDGLTAGAWALPVGAAAILLGLFVLVAALRRRPRTAVALRASTGVFLRPHAVARLAEHAADEVDGVSTASASATRSRVRVRVTTTGDAGVEDAVRAAISERLGALESTPRITVATSGGSR